MATKPVSVRVPEDLKLTVQDDTGGVDAGTTQVAGNMTPVCATKLTWVPAGTGLPCRSAMESVTVVVSPSRCAASRLNFPTDKLNDFCVGRPDATVN